MNTIEALKLAYAVLNQKDQSPADVKLAKRVILATLKSEQERAEKSAPILTPTYNPFDEMAAYQPGHSAHSQIKGHVDPVDPYACNCGVGDDGNYIHSQLCISRNRPQVQGVL